VGDAAEPGERRAGRVQERRSLWLGWKIGPNPGRLRSGFRRAHPSATRALTAARHRDAQGTVVRPGVLSSQFNVPFPNVVMACGCPAQQSRRVAGRNGLRRGNLAMSVLLGGRDQARP